MIKIKQLMTKNPVKIDANCTIREVVSAMEEKKLGSLLVSEGEKIVGIIEESDIIRKVISGDLVPYVTRASDVMSPHFLIDHEKMDDDASDMMSQKKVRHLVVTADSKVVGILSMFDLIKPVYGGKTFWT